MNRNRFYRGVDFNRWNWFCKHSVWISKRTLGRTPIPQTQTEMERKDKVMLRNGVMMVIALMSGGFIGVVVTCCMVAAKKSDEDIGGMMKEEEKNEGTVMQCENETM